MCVYCLVVGCVSKFFGYLVAGLRFCCVLWFVVKAVLVRGDAGGGFTVVDLL